jgi:hypothetical protein
MCVTSRCRICDTKRSKDRGGIFGFFPLSRALGVAYCKFGLVQRHWRAMTQVGQWLGARCGEAFLLAAMLLLPGQARGISIQFDYTYDTGSFFGGENLARRTTLEHAAGYFETLLADTLSPIQASGGNSWQAEFFHPSADAEVSVPDLVVPADTLIVFVGGQALGGSLGQGGPGGFSISGSQSFLDTVEGRGNPGALGPPASQTDFAPWGGSLTFDPAFDWYFDEDPLTFDVPFEKFDFYSVALHELGHLLGVGTANSWENLISIEGSLVFTGLNAVAAHGGPVPLHDEAHWASTVSSPINGVGAFETAMDPAIANGARKIFTDLDNAALADIGWVVVPEPAIPSLMLAAGGCLALLAGRRYAREDRRGRFGASWP